MSLMKFIEAIREGGKEAHEAALTLGLLLEREKVRRPVEDDGDIREILGEELANQKFSVTELETIVDELLNYITEVSEPHPSAVWALSKSYNPRILPHLIGLLDRIVTDPEKEHLAYQALVGITCFDNDLSLTAIRKAAKQGYGQVKETAKQYLRLYSKQHAIR